MLEINLLPVREARRKAGVRQQLMQLVFGLLIGLLVLPLRAAYLALFTLGFSEILRATISAEIAVTRGQAGIELPYLFPNGLTVFGRYFDRVDKIPPYFVMLFLLLFCLAVMAWLTAIGLVAGLA